MVNMNPFLQVYPQQMQQQDDGTIMAVLVQGEEGANYYPVKSGTKVMPIDFQLGKFWLKSNDGGIPSMRHFVFQEVFPEHKKDTNVSREEFDTLSQNVQSLSLNINKLIQELGGGSNEQQ